MLGQRVITAIVLLAVLLPALAADDPTAFLMISLVLIGAAGWEWARLNGGTQPVAAVAAGVGLVVACALAWSVIGHADAQRSLWWTATVAWIVGGALALRGGPVGWSRLPNFARLALGLVLLALAWLAMARARMVGVNFLLSTMCIVWVADIAAYFGGRAFGRRKLAPTISPGKSWAGVYAGMVGVGLLALAWLAADARWPQLSDSVFTLIHRAWGPWGLALALMLLTGLSVVGDLFESLVKRAAGAKDSSRLLPGHGGVLDRVDALLPVLPVAMALASV